MAVPLCFSILQVPRCKIHSLASSWWEGFHNLSRISRNNSGLKILASNPYGIGGGYSSRGNRRTITTKTEGRDTSTQSTNPPNLGNEMLLPVSSSIKSEISEFQSIQFCDNQEKVVKNVENEQIIDLASPVTVIVFDIETTGLSREKERIIEFALRDLSGGENSTFQTLVNPERYVSNSKIHGITTRMVNKPEVPRMEDLIPILLQYVRSRQKPGGYVLWVAHNGRCFDVPFLINEFKRHSTEIPSDWFFLDTIHLARELVKSGAKLHSGISLQALREYYGIPLDGSAHRAEWDVIVLASVFQRLTFDLKLPVSSLVERYSFAASQINSPKKKKSLR